MSNQNTTNVNKPADDKKINWNEIGPEVKIKNPNYKPKVDANGNAVAFKPRNYLVLGKKAVGKTYKFRLLGRPVGFWKFSIEKDGKWRNVKIHINEDPTACTLYTNHQIMPAETYCVNILDREDGKVKLLEGKRSIFEVFKATGKASGKDIGSGDGSDFTLKVTGDIKNYYVCNFDNHTQLTQDEIKRIKTEMYNLNDVIQLVSLDKAEEELFKERPVYNNGTTSTKAPVTQQSRAPQTTQSTKKAEVEELGDFLDGGNSDEVLTDASDNEITL